MSDGRLPPGPLVDLVRTHLGVDDDLEVIDVVLGRWAGDRRRIAGLAPVVAEAGRRGDTACIGILDAAAAELAELVRTAGRRLGFEPSATVPVSYSGGVFAAPEVLAAFGRRLATPQGRFELRPPSYPPVVGAALYAASLAGAPLGAAARQRLRGCAGMLGSGSEP